MNKFTYFGQFSPTKHLNFQWLYNGQNNFSKFYNRLVSNLLLRVTYFLFSSMNRLQNSKWLTDFGSRSATLLSSKTHPARSETQMSEIFPLTFGNRCLITSQVAAPRGPTIGIFIIFANIAGLSLTVKNILLYNSSSAKHVAYRSESASCILSKRSGALSVPKCSSRNSPTVSIQVVVELKFLIFSFEFT